jgi:hypothetical protein
MLGGQHRNADCLGNIDQPAGMAEHGFAAIDGGEQGALDVDDEEQRAGGIDAHGGLS